jgi:hypothetical protein
MSYRVIDYNYFPSHSMIRITKKPYFFHFQFWKIDTEFLDSKQRSSYNPEWT